MSGGGSEDEHDPLEFEINITLFVILGLVSCLIITLNIMTIIVIMVHRRLRNMTGYFMASLAVADGMVGVSTILPLVFSIFSPIFSRLACDFMGFISSVSWVVSVYTLTLLSLDKLILVSRPLHYNSIMTYTRGFIAIALVWFFSCILWLLPLVTVGSYKFNDEEVACYFDVAAFPVQWIVYMVIIFLPASIFISVCACKIYKVSRVAALSIETMESSKDDQQDQGNEGPATKPKGSSNKAIKTLAIIVGAFYLAWIPFIVEHIFKAVLGKLEYVPEWLEIAIFVIAISNSFWNPIIYYATNRTFRGAIQKILCRNKVEAVDGLSSEATAQA